MATFISPQTSCFYDDGLISDIPEDSIEISESLHIELLNGLSAGLRINFGSDGPELYKPTTSAITLCNWIDETADTARLAVIGDPLRATEYERAAIEAQTFKDAGYPAESVPRTVAAWAINGRTAQQAADSILTKSAAFNEALYSLRETRLSGKEQVRAAMAAGDSALANDIAASTVTALESMIKNAGDNSI